MNSCWGINKKTEAIIKTKSAFINIKAGNFFRNPENGLSIVIGLVMVLFMIKCVSVALTSAFNFDGAMNVQVAQNLVKNFEYKTNYDGELFDPRIQTGIPVTLPVAIIFSFFGESFTNGLIVNAIYLILLAFAIVYYLKKCSKVNNSLILLAIILLYGTPNLFLNGFGLLGEIPMFFYFILVVIFLHKYEDTSRSKFLFWAGLFLGLSYLTKTVILICIPALIFAVIFDFVVKRGLTLRMPSGVKDFFQEYKMLPAGFLAPVFVFELYKLFSLGIAAYLQWWKDQWLSILQFAGVKSLYADMNGFFAKFNTHIDLLSSFLGISGTIIVMLLGVLLLSFIAILLYGIYHFWTKQRPGKSEKILFSNHVLVMITVTLSYYGWWLLITPTQVAWERHIFIGYILLEICSVLIISLLIKYCEKLTSKTRKTPYIMYRIFTVGYISLLLVGSVYDLIHTKNFIISFEDSAEKTYLLQAGQYIRNLPESAQILGYGWWQAPVVAFASGRPFDNIFHNIEMRNTGPLNEKYLVVDFFAYYLDADAHKNILDQYDNQLVYSQDQEKILIYKLNSRPLFAYEEFNDFEKGQVDYSRIDFTSNDLDVYVRNVYIGEKANFGKWAQFVSGYLFKYNHESTLKIKVGFLNLEKYDQKPIEIRIYANRKLVYDYPVIQDGSHEIIVPLENISGDTLEITISCNAQYMVEGDDRQLSLILNNMELLK
jgi:hypothetical protein